MTTKVEYQCEMYSTYISLPLGELSLTCAITYPSFRYSDISTRKQTEDSQFTSQSDDGFT